MRPFNFYTKPRNKPIKEILVFVSLMVFLLSLPLCQVFGDKPHSTYSDKEPAELIDMFELESDTVALVLAKERLTRNIEELGHDAVYDTYLLTEARIKEGIHRMGSDIENPFVSSDIRSDIMELWDRMTQLEERLNVRAMSHSSTEFCNFTHVLGRGTETIVKSARFLDHADCFAPVAKSATERAGRYDLLLSETELRSLSGEEAKSQIHDEVPRVKLTVISELQDLDYPNIEFLSNLYSTVILERRLKDRDGYVKQDSALHVEIASLALAALDAASTPQARCVSYYNAAWHKQFDYPEEAASYYMSSIDELDHFDPPENGYLWLVYFETDRMRGDFFNFVLQYGNILEEDKNYLRYSSLLEDAWRISGWGPDYRIVLATELDGVYSKLITQYKQNGKHEQADECLKRQAEITAYINTHRTLK